MPIYVDCPSCSRQLRVPENLLGRDVKCPSCGSTFVAAEAEPAPAPSPPPPPPRPSSRRERDEERFEEEEDRPRSRRRVSDNDDEDDEPDDSRFRRRRRDKPGKVQAIGIMMLIGGILATLHALVFLAYLGIFGVATMGFGWLCCLWPGPYYGMVMGIMAIIRGSALLGENAHRQPAPSGIAIMQIVNIINGDMPNCVMGIIALVFLNEPETRRYFRG
jgi:predicted Zn finger-like uncharacterized protein